VDTRTPDSTRAADFASFMRAYQDMVFSTAARIIGNDAQAEDIAQEVFLKAYEHYDRLRDSGTAGGWLKTVATNRSLNYVSRHRKRWRLFSEFSGENNEEAAEIDFPVPDTLLANLDAGARHELIESALRHLPETHRLPLVLYHFEDMSYEEIARRLHISLSKVKTDIFRARAALARILARSGIKDAGVDE
jgi:RNA polymerase sigma-70 factor (ECF subfamily)